MTPPHTPFWTLDRVAAALQPYSSAALPSDTTSLLGISTDTRTVQPGDCFIALRGERFDAHDFLDQAVAAGAAALVVQCPPRLSAALGVPVYIVDDTLVALGALAHCWRMAWGRPIIGIVGSNGKTSTKELVRAALGNVYAVHATAGTLNNRVGVPLTLLAIPPEADLAVVEIGTSLPGEVALLRDIVRPDVALITSVAEEHLEGLGTLHGVLQEEISVCDGVSIAIVPTAQPEIGAAAAGRAKTVLRAGLDGGDVRADSWSIAPDGVGSVVLDGVTVRPPLRGAHNLRNTMLALAATRVCGVALDAAARGIAAMPVPPMRATWETIGRVTVINDAYNANPGSARAAIEMLAAMEGRQRVAVLGTMRELGRDADRYHDDVARTAVASPADVIAGIGDFAAALCRVAPADVRVITAPDMDELWSRLMPRLAPDATILLKASRGVRLEGILPHITTWATTSC